MIKEIKFIVNENGCHICTSHCFDSHGYPWIKRKGKAKHMSRFLWEQSYGPILKGKRILHKCDIPACINLDHFFLGTQRDNIKDRNSKNRQAKGEHNHSKLTEKEVLQIRQEFGTQKEIAAKYGVGCTTISSIKRRKKWAWL